MAEALYRKYRPATFSDIVGQEHIERTLKNAIEKGKVSHAYLFCGPRGTGKTTTARILAKALLCKHGPTANPDGTCSECEAIASGNHPDVYELDAASRTGVENVREEIISRVHYAPTRGQVKIYIIDEVHMLSTAAFNALLKTLEEPPAHVVFILCTTDPQKVPETIHSRCQRFDFHRISPEAIISRLGAVCVSENVDFEPEALDLIARRADGGMRNALTSLEQLIAFDDGRASYEGAQSLLGGLDDNDIHDIVLAIGKRDVSACYSWTARYVEEGSDLAQFARDLADHTRNLYVMSMVNADIDLDLGQDVVSAMKEELRYYTADRLSRMLIVLDGLIKELRLSSNARLSFEIALTRLVRPDSDLTLEALAERISSLETKLADLQKNGIAVQPTNKASFVAQQQPMLQQARPVAASERVAQNPTTETAGVQPSQNQVAFAQANSVPESAQPQQFAAQVNQIPASAQSQQTSTQVTYGSTSVQSQPATTQVNSAAVSAQTMPAQVNQTLTVPTSNVDVSNPAALQRLWRSVTSTLRKTDPTCGVLFMNARVYPNTAASGILIEFSSDSEFAYNAASKEKPLALLAKTLDECARGRVPFELVLSSASSPKPQVAPTKPAPASVKASASVSNQVPAQVSAQTPVPTPVQVSAPAQEPVPAQVPAPAPVQAQVTAPQTYQRVPASISEDSVPVDIYDSYGTSSYDSDYSMPEYEPVPYGQTNSAGTPSVPTTPANTEMPRSQTDNRENTPTQSQVYRGSSSANQGDSGSLGNPASPSREPEQIQDISELEAMLSASFGKGIKFEEI